MFVVKERLEGLKYNIGFGEEGGGTQGEGIGKSTVQNFYRNSIEVSQHFCSPIVAQSVRALHRGIAEVRA